ncbi:MAG: hypothetical protein WDW36_007709 [Sanguina aurantia]
MPIDPASTADAADAAHGSPRATGCSCFGSFLRPSPTSGTRSSSAVHNTSKNGTLNSKQVAGPKQQPQRDTVPPGDQSQPRKWTFRRSPAAPHGPSAPPALAQNGDTSNTSDGNSRRDGPPPKPSSRRKPVAASLTQLKPSGFFGNPPATTATPARASLPRDGLTPSTPNANGNATAMGTAASAAAAAAAAAARDPQGVLLLELLASLLPAEGGGSGGAAAAASAATSAAAATAAAPVSRAMALLSARLGVSYACLSALSPGGRCQQQQGAAYLDDAATSASVHASSMSASATLAGMGSSGSSAS